MIPLHQPLQSGHQETDISGIIRTVIVAVQLPAVDHADEPSLSGASAESHDQRAVASGLPWNSRIQPHQPRIADEVEIIHQLSDDLGGQERGAVTLHRIGVIDGYEHGSD